MEPSAFVSAEWASAIKAASNHAWTNAAKVVAAVAAERPDARYVEGWAVKGAVSSPVWHAWVDVPLGASGRSWLRIDATPMWRWIMEHDRSFRSSRNRRSGSGSQRPSSRSRRSSALRSRRVPPRSGSSSPPCNAT
jgi:hypothetical protein